MEEENTSTNPNKTGYSALQEELNLKLKLKKTGLALLAAGTLWIGSTATCIDDKVEKEEITTLHSDKGNYIKLMGDAVLIGTLSAWANYTYKKYKTK